MPEPIERPMFDAFKKCVDYMKLAAIGPFAVLFASMRRMFTVGKNGPAGLERAISGLLIAAYPVVQAVAIVALPFTIVASIFTGFAALGEAVINKIKSRKQQKNSPDSQSENSTSLISRSTLENPTATRNEEVVQDALKSRASDERSSTHSMFTPKSEAKGFHSWETVDNVIEQFRGYSNQARLWVLSGDFGQAKGCFERATSYMNTLDAEWEKNKSQFTQKNIDDYRKVRKDFYDPLVSDARLNDQPINRM